MDDLHGLLVTHKRASVEQIEALAEPAAIDVLDALAARGAQEAFVLQTCNRAEVYVHGPPDALDAVTDLADADIHEDLVRRIHGQDVARHLFRVASGLESMVQGEDEILGQVADAYEEATGHLDDSLDHVVEKAIRVGKRVRTETAINEGNASTGSAAAELAARELDLSQATAVVVGAGEMGRLVATPLADRGADLVVTNRTYETARDLADDVGGSAVCFDGVEARFDDVDLLATATDAPHPIFQADDLRGTDLTVLDLANPRDVDTDVNHLDGVDVFTIDDVGQLLDPALEKRARAADAAEEIIDEEMNRLQREFKEKRAEEMLSTIYARAEQLRGNELGKATCKLDSNLDLTADQQAEVEQIMDDLTNALVSQLLATPTQAIKGAAAEEEIETLQAVADVFEVDGVGHERR